MITSWTITLIEMHSSWMNMTGGSIIGGEVKTKKREEDEEKIG